MRPPCYITGTGLVTVQGGDLETTWNALVAGAVLHDTGIVPIARDASLPRVSQLAIEAARHALAAADRPNLDSPRVALVVGTSKGPIEDWIDQLNGQRPPDVCNGIARVGVDVAAAVGHAQGPRLTLAGACASGLHALVRARDLIANGHCDAALVVAAEASTHALFRANFERLGVLARPGESCRPFDRRRRGFLLAEAAAAVWLTRNPRPDAVRIDHAITLADAVHLTAPDRDGAALCHLLNALDVGSPIDLIHSHGTGTLLNDAVEYRAYQTTVAQDDPVVYSHKHAIGHTQGASGLIGVVLNAEMHRRCATLGNTNSHEVMEAAGLGRVSIETRTQACPIRRSLVLAAGFGGTLCGVRLSGRAEA